MTERLPARRVIELVAVPLLDAKGEAWVRRLNAETIKRMGDGGPIVAYLRVMADIIAEWGDEEAGRAFLRGMAAIEAA